MGAVFSTSRILSRLMRWEDYSSFIQVLLGYVLVRGWSMQVHDWIVLAKFFILFSPLLYGGLYTFNDVLDADRDALNTIKKTRPIPSGEISRSSALLISFLLISASFAGSFIIGDEKVRMLLVAFLVANLSYTVILKHIPYVEFFGNAVTHPMRLFAGAWLASGSLPIILYGIWLLGAQTGSVGRRIKEFIEGNESSRPVMRFYTQNSLRILFVLSVCGFFPFILNGDAVVRFFAGFWIVFLGGSYVGYFSFPVFRKIIEFVWR